jgi:hypothetical protein
MLMGKTSKQRADIAKNCIFPFSVFPKMILTERKKEMPVLSSPTHPISARTSAFLLDG